MHKVQPALLRGFDQEYLPREQLQFNALIEIIRKNFELFGFLPIETPSAERKEVLTSKGGVEKEIYALSRLAADAEGDEASTKGALRFDLTVPLARYVAMRERELAFPFRRYQIQRVWRGETPQARKGRFREFYQCDIDIIGDGSLDFINDAEILGATYTTLAALKLPAFTIRLNNRKILTGCCQAFECLDRSTEVLRVIDKIDKIGSDKVKAELALLNIAPAAVDKLIALLSLRGLYETIHKKIVSISIQNDLLNTGLAELEAVTKYVKQLGIPDTAITIDLSIARGLDYYTGTVYETTLNDYPDVGAICSGGRYENLAGCYSDRTLPGVGISIGLTRLFSQLKNLNLIKGTAITPSQAIVIPLVDDLSYPFAIAQQLRTRGINTEMYLEKTKMKKKFDYANKLAIPYAVVIGEDEVAKHVISIKNMTTGEQIIGSVDDLVKLVKA